jgi:hypothetical protein
MKGGKETCDALESVESLLSYFHGGTLQRHRADTPDRTLLRVGKKAQPAAVAATPFDQEMYPNDSLLFILFCNRCSTIVVEDLQRKGHCGRKEGDSRRI